MSRPLITIGITSFNDARYIQRCLDSVLRQTYDRLDVVVVDDHSTDETVSLVRRYGDRVRLIEHTTNSGGYMTGRKEVIASARGEYVGHLDADDFVQPDFVERHVDALVADPALDWVAGNLIVVDKNGRETDRWDYREYPTDPLMGLRRGFVTASVPVPKNGLFAMRFLRNNALDWYELPHTANGSDALTCIKYLECSPKIKLLPYFGLNYRIHGGNRCGRVDERAKMTIDLKEYYVEHHNELVYLSHPGFLKYACGSDEYWALKYFLLTAEFYRAMREFRVPEYLRGPDTQREVRTSLEMFHEPIARYAGKSLGHSDRYRTELAVILRAIGRGVQDGVSSTKKVVDPEAGSENDYIQKCRRILTASPLSLEALKGLAQGLYEKGDAVGAQHFATLAIQVAPHDPVTLNIAGVAAYTGGLHAEAEVLFKRALVGDAQFADAHFNLCELWGTVLHKFAPDTQRRRDLLRTVRWISEYAPDQGRARLMKENHDLRDSLLNLYKRRWQELGLRVLLHRPSNGALKYLMDSWAEVLNFAGVATRVLNWGDRTAPVFEQFRPTAFVTVADPNYMSQLDQDYISSYKAQQGLQVGHITTFEHEFPPCDFLITFHFDPSRDPKMNVREMPLVSLPFAINPLQHYMRPGAEVWDYFFVGTNSPRKTERTKAYLLPIVQRFSGVLAGTKWDVGLGELPVDHAALLYNFARIYPNYSTPRHFQEFNEVNERTFIIPACGGFELMDNPVAIRELFTEEQLAIADSADQYLEMFEYYLHNPEKRVPIVRAGMQRVYREYTLFQVLERLVRQLEPGKGAAQVRPCREEAPKV